MKTKPRVGQVVALNDQGMRQIGGLRSMDEVRQAMRMTVVEVSDDMCDDFPTYNIVVDQPAIRCYFITNHDVDEVMP